MNRIFLLNRESFMPELLEIREKFGISRELSIIDPAQNKEKYGEFIKQGSQQLNTFHQKIGTKLSDFYKDLGKIRKKIKLGREWNSVLARFVVSGILLPPPFSVFVSEKKDDGVIIFELNRHTTKDDIDLAWKNIEDVRKKMFGKVKASFPTIKTINNFNKVVAFETERAKTEEVVGATHIDKKYRPRGVDIIPRINNNEDDDEFEIFNKIKVDKSRLKKITS